MAGKKQKSDGDFISSFSEKLRDFQLWVLEAAAQKRRMAAPQREQL